MYIIFITHISYKITVEKQKLAKMFVSGIISKRVSSNHKMLNYTVEHKFSHAYFVG